MDEPTVVLLSGGLDSTTVLAIAAAEGRRGMDLGVDYTRTHSCYDPGPSRRACGRCDPCLLRAKGFAEGGHADPARGRRP